MKDEQLPALYQSADAAALDAQASFLRCIKAYVLLAALGAGVAALEIRSQLMALIAAAIFAAGLGVSAIMAFRKYENTWYRTRALAESIRTTSWRFVMRAEPFRSADRAANSFAAALRGILKEHKDLAAELAGAATGHDQVTDEMIGMRDLPIEDRMKIYRQERLVDQRNWYAGKAAANKRLGARWFWILLAMQAAAIACTLLRVVWPTKYWPIEIFVVAAGGALIWIQARRFRELSTAYALAAQEIGLAEVELREVSDEDSFSKFVADAENAFSREHTQFRARKG